MAIEVEVGERARRWRLCAAFVIAAAVTPAVAVAQDAADRGGQNFVAAGVGAGPEYLGADSYGATPFFAGRYDAGFAVLELRGLGLSADVLSPYAGPAFSAGPLVRYRFGRDDVENDVVDRLESVDDAVELGGFVQYRILGVTGGRDALSFQLEGAFDVADGHGGYVFTPGISYSRPLTERLQTSVTAFADFGDESFNDAFFSVDTAGAAASGLAPFSADAGFYRTGVSVGANYAITETWGVTGLVSYSRLIGDAADSPIVEDAGEADQVFGGVGVLYKF